MVPLRPVVALLLSVALFAPPAGAKDDVDGSAESPFGALTNPERSRREIVKALEAAGYGNDSRTKLLRRTASEDEAHETLKGKFEDLPRAEQLAELIWRLRDETGASIGGGTGPPAALNPRAGGLPLTLSGRIAAFGHEAIPLLLERLEDERATRIIWWRRGGRAVFFVPIAQVAKEIIEHIADRPFAAASTTVRFPVAPLCRRWWQEVQAKGAFIATADEMGRSAGPTTHFASYLAGRLLRINPVAAAPLVVRARRRQEDMLVRKGILDRLATVTGEGVVPFLRQEMRSGPTLLHRVTAASALKERNVLDPLPTLIAEWAQLKDHGRPYPSTPEQWCLDWGIAMLAVSLASSGTRGVAALTEGLDARPPRARGIVAQVLGHDGVTYHLCGYIGKLRLRANPAAPAEASEAALKAMLRDTAPVGSNYALYRATLRVADLAARSLARRFPKRYTFAITAPLPARDKAIQAMRP